MKLVKREVRAWLAAHEPDAVVGKSFLPAWCPLARYLRTLPGCEFALVGHGTFHTESGRTQHLPPWASQFQRGVDGHAWLPVEITAQQALTILDGITVRRTGRTR